MVQYNSKCAADHLAKRLSLQIAKYTNMKYQCVYRNVTISHFQHLGYNMHL